MVVHKEAGSPSGIGLYQAPRAAGQLLRGCREAIVVSEVWQSSPFHGLVFPGDVVHELGGEVAGSLSSSSETLRRWRGATELSLTVETPPCLASAVSVFLYKPKASVFVGGDFESQQVGQGARLARIAWGSPIDVAVDSDGGKAVGVAQLRG